MVTTVIFALPADHEGKKPTAENFKNWQIQYSGWYEERGEGEVHYDDTAESGKNYFEVDMIWIWREILNHSLKELKQ